MMDVPMFLPAPHLALCLALHPSTFVLAQAEPAPAEPAPPPVAFPPPAAPPPVPAEVVEPMDFQIGFGAAWARRLGDAAAALGPENGFAITAGGEWIYSRAGGLELSLGVGFAYQRFRELVTIDLLQGAMGTREDERSFTFYEFDAHQTVAAPLGFFRPFLRAGIGLGLAYFSTREPAYAPGEKRASRATLPAAIGVDVPTGHGGRVALEVGATFMLGAPDLKTESGHQIALFGPRASLGLAFRQPF
jgi:hypothetical protein